MRFRALGITVCLSLGVTGCASIAPVLEPGEEFLSSHYVLAHEDGFALSKAKESGRLTQRKLSVEKARGDIEAKIFAAGVDAHVRRQCPDLKKCEAGLAPLQILLFAHGGLNGYGADFERMRRMLATRKHCAERVDGAPSRLFASAVCDYARTSYYAIFINWNSDLWDSIRDDLFFIRLGERNPAVGLFTWPFVVAGRAAEAVLNAPNGVYANFKNFSESESVDLATPLAPVRLLVTPAVKTFGTSAWQIMKRRADLLVSPALSVREAKGKPYREGAVWSFLAVFGDRVEISADGVGRWKIGTAKIPVEITLVGHSMGSIVLNRLLAVSAQLRSPLPIKRIVYLAPAASINEVEASVFPYLRANSNARFWAFALNQKDEARELGGGGLPPRGTLLVWIDSFFESVAEPGENRFGRSRSYKNYYFRFGVLPEDPDENTRRRNPFNYCEWDAESADRPRTHSEVGAPEHLEAVLWQTSAELFAPGFKASSGDIHRASAAVWELFGR